MTCSTPRRNPARTPANPLTHGKTRPLVVTGALLLYAMLAGGCAPERPESVPADARSVAKQSGTNPLNFTAPEDGSAYVYDRSSQKMVYSGRLQRGETLEVDPRRNGVRVDGRKVVEAKLRDLNEYQVWFDAEPEAVTAAAPIIVQTAPPAAARPGSTIHVNTSPAPASSTRPPTTTTTTTTTSTTT